MTIWCSAGEQTVEIEFTVGEGDGDEGGSEIEWPAKTNVSPGRVWTVKFNMPVENSDVNKNNVYVVNSRNELENVNVGPGSDGRSIVVTPPEGGYKAGESYTLYITNRIRATTGQFLKFDQDVICGCISHAGYYSVGYKRSLYSIRCAKCYDWDNYDRGKRCRKLAPGGNH